MGEAKRRKTLDPNYGRAGYSYREQKARVAFPHTILDTPSPMPTAAFEYDDYARTIVAEQREGLLAHAIASRAECRETLCLMASRSPTTAESLVVGVCSVTDAKAAWRRALRVMNQSAAMDVDKLFSVALSKLQPGQFLWAHLDVARKGMWARLVPVDDSDIAQVCSCDRSC